MKSSLRVTDVLVPGVIAAVGVLELLVVMPDGWGYGLVLELGAALLLVWRRSWPLVTTTVAAGLLLLIPWTGPQLEQLSTPILALALICYSLGRWIASLRGLVGIALLLLMFLVDYLLVDARSHNFTDVVFVATLAVPPYVFGRISRKLDEQAALLAQQQEQIRDQAVRDERDRIARELHDVIAHSVSAMVVQTAAAQDQLPDHPERASQLLERVAETGREALAETGRLLHLIRDDADELGLRPAPGLDDVDELLEGFRARGLTVEATVRAPPAPLPGGVDVSAYRVVQEALTNALRHGTGPVQLTVDAAEDRLRIECANAVRAGARPGSGLGLQGMAERVGMLGGRLEHGLNGEGRFRVEATIPLPAGAHT